MKWLATWIGIVLCSAFIAAAIALRMPFKTAEDAVAYTENMSKWLIVFGTMVEVMVFCYLKGRW